jgi:hypothetical protein
MSLRITKLSPEVTKLEVGDWISYQAGRFANITRYGTSDTLYFDLEQIESLIKLLAETRRIMLLQLCIEGIDENGENN